MEQKQTNETLEALDDLFSCVSAKDLKKSIHEIFSRYLQTINNDSDLDQFKILAEDFYFLYKFLERVEGKEE